tara:strand:- start:167 stop:481 length:315 start_codon:yes stop_codon:yes gene_type:complete
MSYALIVISTIAIFSFYYCIKFALVIIKMQEAIEESLDIIDEKYNRLNKILEIPIFYNSPEVKSVIAEIQDTRDVLLYIANQLVKDKKTLEEEVSIEKEKDTTA